MKPKAPGYRVVVRKAWSLICWIGLLSVAGAREGRFIASDGSSQSWRINEHRALIWEGVPYLPVGLNVSAHPKELGRALELGVRDLLVRLDAPEDGEPWSKTLERLEGQGARYFLGTSEPPVMARGVSVRPQAYRIDGIVAPREFDLSLPGTSEVLALLVTKRDGAIESHARVKMQDGRFRHAVRPLNDLEHVLLLYPVQRSELMPDYWEGFDARRDALLAGLRTAKPGKGLRGIVNPMGAIPDSSAREQRFVPTSAFFQAEFAAYLRKKYRSPETVYRAWSLSAPDLGSFEALARLVALWSGQRGVPNLWDPQTDRLYRCEQRASSYWTDLEACVRETSLMRLQSLVTNLKRVADVPVFQDWAGWGGPTALGLFDGISMPLMQGMVGADRPASAAVQGGGSLLFATNLFLPEGASLEGALRSLTAIGARGVFLQGGLTGARTLDLTAASFSPKPLFFPENAHYPAVSSQLIGGYWWYPAPWSGDRIDYGMGLEAYRMSLPTGDAMVLWTRGQEIRLRLRMENPAEVVVTAIAGGAPEARLRRNELELTVGRVPVMLTGLTDVPVPQGAEEATKKQFERLVNLAEQLRVDASEESLIFETASSGFDKSPAGSFLTMREILRALNAKVANYTWIEAERMSSGTFGEALTLPGASGGRALRLDSVFPGSYTTEARMPVRVASAQEVWIAARLTEAQKERLQVTVNGVARRIVAGPVTPYGSGFAWYRLEDAQIGGNWLTIGLAYLAETPEELDVDVVLLTPGSFHPDGVRMPSALGPGG